LRKYGQECEEHGVRTGPARRIEKREECGAFVARADAEGSCNVPLMRQNEMRGNIEIPVRKAEKRKECCRFFWPEPP